MKHFTKNLMIAAIACVVTLSLQSCEKRDEVITQTINVQIAKNSSYTYTLPASDDDGYAITTQALHQKVSQVGTDAQGTAIYQYTPALDFGGIDKVVVASQENNSGHGGGGQCSGNHEGKDGFIFNINIEVVDSVAKH